jgi:type III pantothenate kinase
MLLTIDVGNTDTVFALFDGETKRDVWRMPTDVGRQAEAYFTDALKDVTDTIIASVVPATLPSLKAFALKLTGKEAWVIGENAPIAMPILLDNPAEVGADRLVDAVEGYHRYGAPLIIVDFGTATTLEVVSKQGEYLGGAIAPGIKLSVEALKRGTAKLPEVAIAPPPSVIGKNTTHAIQSGIYFGYVELISGLIRRTIENLNEEKVTVVATGGLAHLFAKEIPAISAVDEDLTIRGLMRIYQNTKLSIKNL